MITDTLANIPASLKSRRQWICWKYEDKGNGKLTKPPVSPHTGQTASATDPANWVSLDEAVAASKKFNLSGVGFALAPDDDLTGGDLDHCWNEKDVLSDTAKHVLNLAETYAEISPSGKGIRLIWTGKIPAAVKCDALGIEIYGTGRYLTITGQHFDGTPTEVMPAPKTEALLRSAVNAHAAKTGNGQANQAKRQKQQFASWSEYCQKAGEEPGTQKAFGSALSNRGAEQYRVPGQGTRAFKHIRVRPTAPFSGD
jgi:primase-polymerase (primpol)-like protein